MEHGSSHFIVEMGTGMEMVISAINIDIVGLFFVRAWSQCQVQLSVLVEKHISNYTVVS